jgi:hypothetical protein
MLQGSGFTRAQNLMRNDAEHHFAGRENSVSSSRDANLPERKTSCEIILRSFDAEYFITDII